MHIQLPPRPDEISEDYVPPPMKSPRRMSHQGAGPSSPPQVNPVGAHIFFHTKSPSFDLERKVELSPSSPAHSRLFNTLATTAKAASKWRTSVDPGMSAPQHSSTYPPVTGPSSTAQPVDINHSTPFAPPEYVAGSYTAPSGAPGFKPVETRIDHSKKHEEDYSGTELRGRRDNTTPVLAEDVADKVG